MSLKTLFTITLSALLIIILGVVFAINVKNVQRFLENQVYSTSQDTVYSLGMSLSTLNDKSSPDDVELMINAIFDSGYYEYIRFYDLNRSVIYEATLPLVVKNVPEWYVNAVPIELKEAVGEVNQGWTRKGSLAVKGHAGYAYSELYKNFKILLAVFGAISLVSFIFLILIINTLLRSLKRIKNQANSIAEHKFIIEKSSPFISEFDVLIKSMNKMVVKVESIFKSEVATFEQYQNVLYRDEETQLPNKKYFTLKLKEILNDESRNIGYLAIISVAGLQKIKEEKDYKAYREALERFIKSIPKELSSNNLLARISDSEIAVLFNTHDVAEIEEYFNKLQDALSVTSREIKSREKLLCFSIGVAPYFENDKLSEALSRVDYALSRSKINGCNIIDIYEVQESKDDLITSGKGSWKEKFEKIFSENRIVFATQSAINDETQKIFHDEVLVRVREEDGSLHTAGYYLPMANALGLVPKFDHSVIYRVVKDVNLAINPVAINVSKDFILQSIYFLEIRNALSKLRKSNPKTLHFESAENEILLELDSFIEFSDMLHAHNQLFGIDRFTGIENLAYIERLRPDYVKINVNFIMESYENNRAILNTLNVLSKTMGISLIITAVQSEEELKTLKEIGYENFQGHFISKIKI